MLSLNWELVLQVLNIPTKINKGTVEITSNVALIKAGEKVGASEATLLAKLGIKPFSYGLIVKFVSTLTQSWAARYNILLAVKLTPKGIVFSFLFPPSLSGC